jgi:hypothetical protein
MMLLFLTLPFGSTYGQPDSVLCTVSPEVGFEKYGYLRYRNNGNNPDQYASYMRLVNSTDHTKLLAGIEESQEE